jgi:acetate kinase
MNILVLNAGSSTLKFKLLVLQSAIDEQPQVLVSGLLDKWDSPQARMTLSIAGKDSIAEPVAIRSAADAAQHSIRVCETYGIDALGHRVVHGGPRFLAPVRIDREVVRAIRDVSSLAPLHNKSAIEGIDIGLSLLPHVPAGAVFDTAFHSTLPETAAQYAIPRELAEKHNLRRYGFHGISHAYVSRRLLQCIGREARGTRLITFHLGNGASVCAIRDGRSVDTSMGLTPLEGLVMGTRCGDIDPGLVLYLFNAMKVSAADIDDLLNHHRGVLGLSGKSSDFRELQLAALAGDAQSEFALDVFAYRAKKYLGAYAACLGGLDAVAFTGGIGEHSPEMRARISRGLEFIDVRIDPERNNRRTDNAPARISPDTAAVQLWVVPTDEEGQIARDVFDVLR